MRQQGNILFLILIAVALFAALSYAVTGASRSGSESISKDKAKISAAEIVQYGVQLEQAVTRLTVVNGCSDTQLSFERAPFDGSDTNYVNINSPSDFTCHVFHPSGGNAVYKTEFSHFSNDLTVAISSAFRLHGVMEGPAPYTAEDWDLGLFINDIGENVCKAVNASAGMRVDIFAEDQMPTGSFDGSFTVRSSAPDNGETGAGAIVHFNDNFQNFGCYKRKDYSEYIFVYALITRLN